MKKTIFLLLFFLPTFFSSHAQTIEVERVFNGLRYTQDGKMLRMRHMVKIMSNNENAFKLMYKARTTRVFGKLFSHIGQGLIGFPLGVAIAKGDPNWNLAYIGAALVGISIPFRIVANKKARKAINIYNEGLSTTSFTPISSPSFGLKFKSTSIGLVLNF